MTHPVTFSTLQVENMFAYCGLSEIDLSSCTNGRNMVVVQGANGAGKTSLLNAIKLLFVGTENVELRRVGYGSTEISRRNYVMGVEGSWYGVFNRASNANVARVRLAWRHDGCETAVERRVTRNGNAFEEQLLVTQDGGQLSEERAKAFIAALAPSEVVPFYFFDGEQVQSFADAEQGREPAEIERLLKLSFIPDLIRELDSYRKAKARAGLPSDIRQRLVEAENESRASESQIESYQRLRLELEGELLDVERARHRLDIRRNELRTGISPSDKRRMQNRIDLAELQRARLNSEINDSLPSESPWLTNPVSVRKVFQLIESQLSTSADAALSRQLHNSLPGAVRDGLKSLDPSVSLTDAQYESLRTQLSEFLVVTGVPLDARIDPILSALSSKQLVRLRDRYLMWSSRGGNLVSLQVEQLQRMRALTAELSQARKDLDESELATEDAKRRFDDLSLEIEGLDREVRLYADKLAELRVNEDQAARKAENAKELIRQYEKEYDTASKESVASKLALLVRRAVDSYRQRKRAQIRQSVEDHLNSRIPILLAPTQLIKSVTLNDSFEMRYFDENNDEVARRSVSAGMRQLVAMGMLWALRDEAERNLPVVIDTPLGRIDRENRMLLMDEYFPKAGRPLILLPTNSELDGGDLDYLRPRICRRYRIVNVGGTRAKIVAEDDRFSAGNSP